jgi:cobalt-zinc-cadmium resistance protein CzcA
VSGEIERRLKQFPELETIVSRTGQTGVAVEARGVDKTGFVGALKPRSEWTSATSRDELTGKMRDAIADLPGVVASFSQPIQCRIDELVAGTRAQVIVKLFGDDTGVLKQKAGEMAAVLGEVRGVSDMVVERIAGQPYLTVAVDREKLARYGVNASDVLHVIELGVAGMPVGQVYKENRVFDIAIRFPEDRRQSPEALGSLLIDVPGGYRVALRELADVTMIEGPVQISRENGQRRIGIELNVSGRDIGGFVKDAQARLRQRVALPAGYFVTWGGQFENQQQAMRRLMLILPVVVGVIFVLLMMTFRSAWLASLVLINLPFAQVGGVFALMAWGLYLSVPGRTVAQAVLQGCESRLRAVLMTASIAIFSLIPMVFATGPGSEVQRPLAVVVIGGLLSSTALTLFVLPILYSWVEERRESSSMASTPAASR